MTAQEALDFAISAALSANKTGYTEHCVRGELWYHIHLALREQEK